MKPFNISPQTNEVNVATIIRKATINDIWQIYNLYKTVAIVNLGSLTQQEDEITLEYVSDTVRKGMTRGLILVIENDDST
jgi:hypothetical protein